MEGQWDGAVANHEIGLACLGDGKRAFREGGLCALVVNKSIYMHIAIFQSQFVPLISSLPQHFPNKAQNVYYQACRLKQTI